MEHVNNIKNPIFLNTSAIDGAVFHRIIDTIEIKIVKNPAFLLVNLGQNNPPIT